MGRISGTDAWIPVEEHPDAEEEDIPGVVSVSTDDFV